MYCVNLEEDDDDDDERLLLRPAIAVYADRADAMSRVKEEVDGQGAGDLVAGGVSSTTNYMVHDNPRWESGNLDARLLPYPCLQMFTSPRPTGPMTPHRTVSRFSMLILTPFSAL